MPDNKNKDYYQLLKDESYRALNQKEVQLSAARDNAYKYTMNSLQNQGYANQGLAQSTNAGIGNSYLSAMANARAQNASDINNINLQQAQNETVNQQNEITSLSNYMQNAFDGANGDRQEYINAMKAYGGDYVGDDGNFTQDFLNRFSDVDQRALRGLQYQYMRDTQETQNIGYSTTADLVQALKETNDGKIGSLQDEIKYITGDWGYKKSFVDGLEAAGAELQNGDVVKITQNKNNSDKAAYLMYKDGKWYVTNQGAYMKAANGYWVHSAENQNNSMFIRDRNGKSMALGQGNSAVKL